LDVEPDPITAQRVALLVADVWICQHAIVVRMGVMFQNLFPIEIVHVCILSTETSDHPYLAHRSQNRSTGLQDPLAHQYTR
jgi:hypothetical protein